VVEAVEVFTLSTLLEPAVMAVPEVVETLVPEH
jgi:hypothetical protein